MPEVAGSGKDHSHVVTVSGVDGLLVSDGAAGLDYGSNATLRGSIHVVGKGKKASEAITLPTHLSLPLRRAK